MKTPNRLSIDDTLDAIEARIEKLEMALKEDLGEIDEVAHARAWTRVHL